MQLRVMYNRVASCEFDKFCQMNDISLNDKIIKIKHFDDVIMSRETRLMKSVDGYLMKQIEDLVFSYYINEQSCMLNSLAFFVRIVGKNGEYYDWY